MKTKLAILAAFLVALALPAAASADSYNTGDTSSTADENQAVTLEVDPAIEVISIASDSDTVSPQAGGDADAGDNASFEASVDLRSNLAWTSTAAETGSMGLADSTLDITGDGDTGNSNKTAGAEGASIGDGTQNYTVQYGIDVSWADNASPEADPYDGTVDHDVSNTLAP